jgi:carbon-monoxide dehydrogenase medium subunit
MGSVAPTPLRLPKTEALLSGKPLTDALIEEAAALAATEVSPIDDVRADRQYRLDIVSYLVRDGLAKLR